MELIKFSQLEQPVAMDNCGTLLPILNAAMRDWNCERVESASTEPKINLELIDAGFKRQSPWLDKASIFKDPLDAVCDLTVDLIHAYIAEHENLLCLHCAAVQIGGNLTVFPTTYRGGKSTLTTKLASLGVKIFSDDVLPVNKLDLRGLALGILPRLRIPIPNNSSTAFHKFVDCHNGPGNHRYQYVALDEDHLAKAGSIAKINRFILLERQDEGRAELEEIDKALVLKSVILRNFARENPAIDILDALHRIVDNSDCYSLRFANTDEAGELLLAEFKEPLTSALSM